MAMKGPANRLVLARLVSSTGAEAAFFVGLWGKAAYEFDGTVADLAVMSGLIGIAQVVGSIAAGVLVDRWDGRRTAILAEAVFVPATLSLILADTLPRLLALGVLVWLAGAMLETAITSLPPVLVDDADLDAANARLESANWLALVAGPGLGGLLFPLVGFSGIFVLDAVSSVVALVLIAGLRIPDRAPATPVVSDPFIADAGRDASPGPLREAWAGLRHAARVEGVRTALLLAALPAIAFGMFVALEPLFYRDVVGAPVETLGYVNALFGVGLFVGSQVVERVAGRLTSFRVDVLLTVAAGLGSLAYVGTGDLRVVLVGAVTWSVPLGMALPLTRTLAQRAASPAYVGRVTGAISTVSAGAALLPVVVAPALAAAFGVQRVLLGCGVLAALLAPLLWRSASRLDAAGVSGPGRPGGQAPPAGAPAEGVASALPLEAGEAAPEQP